MLQRQAMTQQQQPMPAQAQQAQQAQMQQLQQMQLQQQMAAVAAAQSQPQRQQQQRPAGMQLVNGMMMSGPPMSHGGVNQSLMMLAQQQQQQQQSQLGMQQMPQQLAHQPAPHAQAMQHAAAAAFKQQPAQHPQHLQQHQHSGSSSLQGSPPTPGDIPGSHPPGSVAIPNQRFIAPAGTIGAAVAAAAAQTASPIAAMNGAGAANGHARLSKTGPGAGTPGNGQNEPPAAAPVAGAAPSPVMFANQTSAMSDRRMATAKLNYLAEIMSSQQQEKVRDIEYWKRVVDEFFSETATYKVSFPAINQSFIIPANILPRYFLFLYETSGLTRMTTSYENPREYLLGGNSRYLVDCRSLSQIFLYDDGGLIIYRGTAKAVVNFYLKIDWMEFTYNEPEEYVAKHAISHHIDSKDMSFGLRNQSMLFLEMADTFGHMQEIVELSKMDSIGPLEALEMHLNKDKSPEFVSPRTTVKRRRSETVK